MKAYIGLDLGSSSMKAVVMNDRKEILYKTRVEHHGKTADSLRLLLKALSAQGFSMDSPVIITGVNGSLLVNGNQILADIPAIEKGAHMLFPEAKAVLEIGAQNARYLVVSHDGTPPEFAVNESCAGGTGSFFEDQMYRLGLPMAQYSEICRQASSVPRLSGRCSVFAKTDIIHRQQEGIEIPDILLGLCYATIRNIKATIIRNMKIETPFLLCGGIQYNEGVAIAVKDVFQLKDDELLLSADGVFIQAVGAAVMAVDGETELTLEYCIQNERNIECNRYQVQQLPPLRLEDISVTAEPVCRNILPGEKLSLGIDVGSTSTNLVLINLTGQLVDFQYLRTMGDPQAVVRQGLRNIYDKYGEHIHITSVGVTGSGRYLISQLVGADSVRDEITAQAKAAIMADPETDTVFEIGGQDSKYIHLEKGEVTDFQMNKICAAGTGSFLEEQSNRLAVPVESYGSLALTAKHPAALGERCTVFIENSITACQAKGVDTADILAGLCYSVIHNYLFKVVGNNPVGEHIVLQGGVCYNAAVIAAFRSVYGNRVKVSPYFAVSGAYGAAKIAAEEIGNRKTQFCGLLLEKSSKQDSSSGIIRKNVDYYLQAKTCFLDGYERKCNPSKKTVGIPYVLLVHKLFPMFRAYFETLGFNCLLSPETDESIIEMAQKYAQAETCYPVKLIYGHMAWLAEQKVDYIFLPSVLTMKHEKSNVYHNYGCVYMQAAPKIIFENMQLDKFGIKLLNPHFSLDFGKKAMAECMISVGAILGKAKPACMTALLSGAMAVRKQTQQVERIGERLLADLSPNEKVLVMVTRNYGIEDPVLNMAIPQELLKRGYKVLTISHLPAHDLDISDEYENMYWPFGQHIIAAAKMIARHPNLYAVYLTNHGCGPDTMLSHLFRKEMGEKPYLNIEVDEHYSKVGVITRIEAFLHSIEKHQTEEKQLDVCELKAISVKKVEIGKKIVKSKKLFLPYLYPYAELVAKQLNRIGYMVTVLPEADERIITAGQKLMTSKEYLSFMTLAGSILANEETRKNVFVIPQTEGSETDGVFARVLYDWIGREGSVIAPVLETLPFDDNELIHIFPAILAGDLILTLPIEEREKMLGKILELPEITLKSLKDLAANIRLNKKKRIAVIGDPYLLYHPYLNGRILEELEYSGKMIQWMPLGEYLCYLWKYRAETAKEHKIVDTYWQQILELSKVLDTSSPYSKSLKEIKEVAGDRLGHVSGGNISYRYGKQFCLENINAVLYIASTYENTQTIMDLNGHNRNIPCISLYFEGRNYECVREKLKSFMYYIAE